MKQLDEKAPAMSMPRERGMILRNLADFQTELARIAAGYVPGLKSWRMRIETPRQIFIDFRMVQDLRARQKELSVVLGATHFSRSVPAVALLDLLCDAPSPEVGLSIIYSEVKAKLAESLESFLDPALGIYDLPSAPLLEANRDMLRKQIEWAAKEPMSRSTEREDFERRIEPLLAELPAELSRAERPKVQQLRTARKCGKLPLLDAALPDGFAARTFRPEPKTEDGAYASLEHHYAANFLQEVQASDSCATLLFDAPDMPWEFYFDCSRHMWDESRHSVFGEKKLNALGLTKESVGLSTTAYRVRQTIEPHDRYAALTTQEADAFPSKHKGLQAALENNDALGAMTWSYDIADETQHVRYGQKWLPVLIAAMGDPRSLDQVRADATNWRATVLQVAYRAKKPEAAG